MKAIIALLSFAALASAFRIQDLVGVWSGVPASLWSPSYICVDAASGNITGGYNVGFFEGKWNGVDTVSGWWMEAWDPKNGSGLYELKMYTVGELVGWWTYAQDPNTKYYWEPMTLTSPLEPTARQCMKHDWSLPSTITEHGQWDDSPSAPMSICIDPVTNYLTASYDSGATGWDEGYYVPAYSAEVHSWNELGYVGHSIARLNTATQMFISWYNGWPADYDWRRCEWGNTCGNSSGARISYSATQAECTRRFPKPVSAASALIAAPALILAAIAGAFLAL